MTQIPEWVARYPEEIFATDERIFGVGKKRAHISIDEWFQEYLETGLHEMHWLELMEQQKKIVELYEYGV